MAQRFAWAVLVAWVWVSMGSASAVRVGNMSLPGEVGAAQVGLTTLAAPALLNSDFECAAGFGPQSGIRGSVPSGWTAVLLSGNPMLDSTRVHFAGSCDSAGFIERIAGLDSLAFLSEEIETPPAPGKPFDVAVFQQVHVTPGVAYSLSGWMVSLCGGSATPNDCPAGYYMAKMLGIDPTGGTDPGAASIVWVEDRRNFTESRWANLRLSATAQGEVLTVFARVRSPYRWHGAHAFVDAISLVVAPTAGFTGMLATTPVETPGVQVDVGWSGALGPDIPAIPGGAYELYFDVQYRRGEEGAWTDWLVGQAAGAVPFGADVCGGALSYEFRVRARAEQPAGSHGAWPNHRYPGEWSALAQIVFVPQSPCVPRGFVPFLP
ncbi:MAG: hypothetical protein AUK03_09260 [Anaerolineae bacterium CG2_30_64_16]|nr:MAG: hypothetical protein AUK03_09260 [Anaerolineae bacterium CG2_30_64_16]